MHGLGGMVVKAVLRQRLMQRPGKRVLCLTAGKGGGIYRFYGAACLHDHDAIGKVAHGIQIVGDDQNGFARIGQIAQMLQRHMAYLRIQP